MTPTARSSRRTIGLTLAAMALVLYTASSFGALPGWLGGGVKGSGTIRTQAREPGSFNAIALGLPAQLELQQGNVEGVTIETDDNLLPMIETSINNGELRIRAVRGTGDIHPTKLKIIVRAKQVERVAVAGSGELTAESLKSPRLALDIGGSGSINVRRLESDSVSLAIGGSGTSKLGGVTRKLSVSIGGSGEVKAAELKAQDVEVSIGGSGEARVWATGSLTTAIAGSGDVEYYGDPKVQTSVAGAGSVKRRGASPQ
jgi:hypothetical protein